MGTNHIGRPPSAEPLMTMRLSSPDESEPFPLVYEKACLAFVRLLIAVSLDKARERGDDVSEDDIRAGLRIRPLRYTTAIPDADPDPLPVVGQKYEGHGRIVRPRFVGIPADAVTAGAMGLTEAHTIWGVDWPERAIVTYAEGRQKADRWAFAATFVKHYAPVPR
jgi:hypothetical protein